MTLRLGVLVSGSGTNLQAILDAIEARRLDAEVRVVLSNVAGAAALDRARKAGVPAIALDHKAHASREAFDAEMVKALRDHEVDYVALAGFMRILSSVLLDAFPWRVVNIHPSLLPAFPGVDAQAQAVRYGARVSGCTVHFVDGGCDTGPIIAQSLVPVLPDDDAAALRARILPREHQLFVAALQWIAEGRVAITPASAPGERARVQVRGVSPLLGLSS